MDMTQHTILKIQVHKLKNTNHNNILGVKAFVMFKKNKDKFNPQKFYESLLGIHLNLNKLLHLLKSI